MNGYSPIVGKGLQRTDMHCHECGKNFVAELDFSIDGEHVVECPHCDHEHYRVIKDGQITSERWKPGGGNGKKKIRASTWKKDVLQIRTSTVSQFIRDAWLNRSDL